MIGRFTKPLSYFAKFIYHRTIHHSDYYNTVIYDAVTDLGGIYVKLIQFVCLRTEIFSDTDKMRFLSFYDRVAPDPLNISEYLRAHLSKQQITRISSVEKEPFAAGSFAQVYRAKLTDGASVIIKVKRAHIRKKLTQDFIVLRVLATIFNLVYYQTYIDVIGLLEEFKRITKAELDYRKEVRTAQFFYNIYKDHSIVRIPQTYEDLSTNDIIVQEYINGVPLTELIRYRNQGGDYKKWLKDNYGTDIFVFLKSIPYEMGIQMFNYDHYYADPHPGNIMILPDNRYAIVDFGILGDSPRNKRTYYNLIKEAVNKSDDMDMEKLGNELLKFGANSLYSSVKTVDYALLEENPLLQTIIDNLTIQLDQKKEKFHETEIQEKDDFSQMFVDLMTAGKKFKVRIPDEMFALMRGSQLYKSYAVFLEPLWHHMRKTYIQILSDVDISKLMNQEFLQDQAPPLENALEEIIDWAGDIAENDLPLYNKITDSIYGNGHI